MMPDRRSRDDYIRPRPVKLTESQVESILKANENDTATAAKFGVSQPMVTRIRAGKAWKHGWKMADESMKERGK